MAKINGDNRYIINVHQSKEFHVSAPKKMQSTTLDIW